MRNVFGSKLASLCTTTLESYFASVTSQVTNTVTAHVLDELPSRGNSLEKLSNMMAVLSGNMELTMVNTSFQMKSSPPSPMHNTNQPLPAHPVYPTGIG